MTHKNILVIEDDPDILELIEYNLNKEGFRVQCASDGEIGLREAMRVRPALIILDLMLPGIDGLSVCKKLKAQKETEFIPVIMLTAKSEESDVVVGLELGADDYITKPFSPRELTARIRALLRRSTNSNHATIDSNMIVLGPLSIDSMRHEVKWSGQDIAFTLAEYKILVALAATPGRVYSRDQLLDRITGGDAVVIDRNIDVHVRSIRKKLGEENDLIQTVRGVGYKCRDLGQG